MMAFQPIVIVNKLFDWFCFYSTLCFQSTIVDYSPISYPISYPKVQYLLFNCIQFWWC